MNVDRAVVSDGSSNQYLNSKARKTSGKFLYSILLLIPKHCNPLSYKNSDHTCRETHVYLSKFWINTGTSPYWLVLGLVANKNKKRQVKNNTCLFISRHYADNKNVEKRQEKTYKMSQFLFYIITLLSYSKFPVPVKKIISNFFKVKT